MKKKKQAEKGYLFLTGSLLVTLVLGLFSVSTGRAFLLEGLREKKDRHLLITNVIADHHWFKDEKALFTLEDSEGLNLVKAIRLEKEPQRVSKSLRPPPKDTLVFTGHIVRKGETLSSIAGLYGVDVSTVKGSNTLRSHILKVGQKLKVPNQKGILYKIRKGQTLWDISRAFKLSIDKISHLNDLKSPGKLKAGDEIFLPGSRLLLKKVNFSNSSSIGYSQREGFIRPVAGRISSRFGYRIHPIYRRRMFHYGLDIKAPYGRKVVAAKSGQVTFSGWKGGYGRAVIIKHDRKYSTLYAHNSALLVERGQYVKKGQAIARIGNTGLSTGAHLHFEVRAYNRPQDPLKYLP
ncbi:M23 family metallopeptidase [bacterium]|nr:M23 family metallopeptidase [bacterium]MBU1615349.1 M23 family metallopeptidase [bacterium]